MRTPLFEQHLRFNARMVPFAGWEMPVQYKGVGEEHNTVRKCVGLFDVSHMGEVRVLGPKALETLQWLTTNDVSKLQDGQAQYSLLPNETGGLVDDIIVYCLKANSDYLVCVNAANAAKDWEWMNRNNRGAEMRNESADWGQIAVQGPKAMELMTRVFSEAVLEIGSFEIKSFSFKNSNCLIARTGYTGEDGVEIFVPAAFASALWIDLMEKGADLGVQPIGLAARDTLRLEMKYSLYGNEIDATTDPYEAGLGWVVKAAAKDFLGKQVILDRKKNATRKLIGFQLVDKGVPRTGYEFYSSEGEKIGSVTSGTMSPTLNLPIGIGYLPLHLAEVGKEFLVDIRGRKIRARVVPTPFVKRSS